MRPLSTSKRGSPRKRRLYSPMKGLPRTFIDDEEPPSPRPQQSSGSGSRSTADLEARLHQAEVQRQMDQARFLQLLEAERRDRRAEAAQVAQAQASIESRMQDRAITMLLLREQATQAAIPPGTVEATQAASPLGTVEAETQAARPTRTTNLSPQKQ